MTDRNEPDDVDRRLRAADPAAGLSPLAPWQIEQLKETAMSTPHAVNDASIASPPATPRRRRVLALAGAGVLAAAAIAGGVAAVGGPGETQSPTRLAGPAPADPTAICAVPTAAILDSAAVIAFRGTVTQVDAGVVTIRVDDRFRGDVHDTVTVDQGDPDDVVDGAAPTFEKGTTYLVAADAGTVLSCGLTGVDEPSLRSVYDQAF